MEDTTTRTDHLFEIRPSRNLSNPDCGALVRELEAISDHACSLFELTDPSDAACSIEGKLKQQSPDDDLPIRQTVKRTRHISSTYHSRSAIRVRSRVAPKRRQNHIDKFIPPKNYCKNPANMLEL